MDLFANSLDIDAVDGNYGIKDNYRTKEGTLSHNNYTIDFDASTYIVTRRIINSYFFNQGIATGTFEDNNLVLTLTTSQTLSLTIMYATGLNGKTSDTIHSDDYKIQFKQGGVTLDAMPTQTGTYDVVIVDCYANSVGAMSLNFTLVIS